MAPSLWLTLVHFQSVYEDSMSSGWHSFCSWVSLLVSWRSPLGFWLRSLDSVHLGSVDSNSGFYNLWMYPNSHLDSCFLGWLYSLVFWWSFVWGVMLTLVLLNQTPQNLQKISLLTRYRQLDSTVTHASDSRIYNSPHVFQQMCVYRDVSHGDTWVSGKLIPNIVDSVIALLPACCS